MPPQATFYQRIFHRDFAFIFSTRTIVMVRRNLFDRICFSLTSILLLYIAWQLIHSIHRFLRFERPSLDQIAYIHAINRSAPMIENTKLCTLDRIDFLIVIISSSSHAMERQSIRDTWGSLSDLFDVQSQRLFVIGYQEHTPVYQELVKEAKHESDILHLTVDDHSSTLKELGAYQWLEKYCTNVKYIFKTEDDLFVNSFLLHELVRELKKPPKNNQTRLLYNVPLDSLFRTEKPPNLDKFLFGWAYASAPPERNNSASPYYVSYSEYSQLMYPRYCSGFGYLMNANTRRSLTLEASKDPRPFRLADVYITGILPERLQFVCDILPFTYHQGSADSCIELIKKNNKYTPAETSPPLLYCSTGRHTGQGTYTDYHQIWMELRQIYNDRLLIG